MSFHEFNFNVSPQKSAQYFHRDTYERLASVSPRWRATVNSTSSRHGNSTSELSVSDYRRVNRMWVQLVGPGCAQALIDPIPAASIDDPLTAEWPRKRFHSARRRCL